MAATPEYYEQVIDAFPDTESLTVLIVTGRSRDQVAAALDVDLGKPVDNSWSDNEDETAWAISTFRAACWPLSPDPPNELRMRSA